MRTGFASLMLAGFLAWGWAGAEAASFPEKPVKIVVPAAAGGAIDAAGRLLAQALSEHWGKQVIVENRAGASMAIGAAAVAQATPDGYTLLVAHDGVMAVNPIFIKNLGYDAQQDFAPLGVIARLPLALFVHESVPAASVRELVAYAKSKPGKLNHASGGPASLLALELFKAMAGVEIVNVNYRGSALSINDLIAGNVQLVFADVASGGPAFGAKNVRALAVTGETRSPTRPDLPTVAESGLPGFATATWIGAFAPARTPREIVDALERAVGAVSETPDLRRRLTQIGMEPASLDGAQTRALVKADGEKWAKLARERHIAFGN